MQAASITQSFGTASLLGPFLAGALLSTVLVGCSGADPAPEQENESSETSSDQKEPDEDSPSSAGDSGTSSVGDSTDSQTPSTDKEDSSGTGSGGESGAGDRDCSKIAWGNALEESSIIPRGDVRGYVDQDGDGRLEKTEQDAGMCQLHMTGKKCGLVLYSRRT